MSNNRAGGPGGFGAPGRGPGGPGRGPGGGGPMGALSRTEKAKDFSGTMRKLLKYIGRYKIPIALVMCVAVASTILSTITPKIMGGVTNRLASDYVMMSTYDAVAAQLPEGETIPPGTTGADILPLMPEQAKERLTDEQLETFSKTDLSSRPSIDFETIGNTLLLLLVLYIISAVLAYGQGFVMAGVSAKITYTFRQDISKKIHRMPLKYFDSTLHGDILSRVTNDVDTVNQTLNQSITQIITSVVALVGVFIMMLTISWQLTLVTLLTVPVSLVIVRFIVVRSQKHFKAQQENLGDLNGQIEENFSGHSIVRVYGAEKRAIAEFSEINARLYKSSWLSQFISGMMMPLMGFVGNLGYVGVCLVGGYLAINGTLQIGDIQAFQSYIRQFTQPITQLATVMNTLQSTAAAAERVFFFLEQPEEVPESATPTQIAQPSGNVAFSHVSFGYNSDRVIIKDFNESVKPGQKIAIVGPTGAGKTTIVNLLMRFYDVDKGQITVDGVDIRDMRRADLRAMFGMVLQDTWLFNGTIRDNISYSKPNATQEEIRAVAKAAQVDHFILSMPGGYDMVLTEDASNISQGQKQLLTIARAMLANPPMLILDEATSSVDTRTEVLIQSAMDNLMKGRTSFVIAHRLSTIKNADRILVLDNGNIIEQGTHDELLAAGGFYSDLYNSQFTSSAQVGEAEAV